MSSFLPRSEADRAHPYRLAQLTCLDIRHRGQFDYVDGELANGESIKLMRLRYGGSASRWGSALYLASSDKYEDSILPTGSFADTLKEALDMPRPLPWLNAQFPDGLSRGSTPVSPDWDQRLLSLLAPWNLSTPRLATELTDLGDRSRVWRVESNNGPCVAKPTFEGPAFVEPGLRIAAVLDHAGIPTGAPILTVDGKLCRPRQSVTNRQDN
ncbi:hypothetical protein OG530_40445 [Streptomyces decoyicus]|uniref:hypothetical protein n=1 Tax=Streptomyces decoyicus TaxID=249567 RepID=UPI002E19FFFA